MQISEITPLSVTPEPIPGESFRGYTLRLSESNGLNTPSFMLSYAGMSELESRLVRHPVRIVAALAGRHVSEFDEISYSDDNMTGETRLAGHHLTQNHLNLKDSRICPDCINELGYIPAIWDLANVHVCHVHKKYLVSECQSCHQKLHWFRPGLLTCRCEHDLTGSLCPEAPINLVELTKVISAVIERKILPDSESTSGMPFANMTRMSLQTLISVIHTIGAHALSLESESQKWRSSSQPEKEFIKAAEIFSGWPNNFLELLKRDAQSSEIHSLSIRKKHLKLYSKIFKPNPVDEVTFLRDAFIIHANSSDSIYLPDSRILNKTSDQMLPGSKAGIYAMAAKLGVMPSTLRKWAQTGKIPACTATKGGSTIFLFDAHTEAAMLKENPEGDLELRKAAAFIGLPVSVLKIMRSSGICKSEYRTVIRGMFSIPDLKNAISALVSKARPHHEADNQDQLISISAVMRKKFRSADTKAAVIVKIHEGEIPAFGPASSIGELKVSRRHVQDLADGMTGEIRGKCLVRRAAEIIGCDNDTVGGMVDTGILDSTIMHGDTYLEIKQVEDFRSKYVPMSAILKEKGFSSARGVRICEANSIEVLNVIRRIAKKSQPFIRLHDKEALLKLML